MGRISTGIGLMSGINSRDIIDQLMMLESRPKIMLQSRIDRTNEQRVALVDISTRLTSLRLTSSALKRPTTFLQSSATSSNENVMTATAASSAATGSFQFQVARLVTTQQRISQGFADPTATMGAGTLTIEMGGGELRSQTPLAQLNGGEGVRRGVFRITDRSGNSAIIDTTSAVTLDDVVRRINTALDIGVRASVGGEGLVLTDTSGGTGSFIVQDLGDGGAAADLGIVASVEGDTISGTDINYLGRATSLAQVNDGRGVRTVKGMADLRITAGDGSSVDIDLTVMRSIGEVLEAINTAAEGKVRAEVVPGANGIRLVDTSGGGSLSVAALNGSSAAADLGIEGASGATVDGSPVIAGLNTVLISSLNGGEGLPLGSISITDRAGGSATVDLSSAVSVQTILDRINNAAGVSVKASLNASENGIQIQDISGGSGNLIIADVDSTTAEALGVAGSFDLTQPIVAGQNLQRQWVSQNTLLSDYNGGRGVTPGRFRITDSTGASAVVDLTKGQVRLGEVIDEINSRGLGITASINANGDGLLLTDTAGGALKMKVENLEGTAATDMRIAGEAEEGLIDGSFEVMIEVGDDDALADVQQKINDLGFGLSASIINDGSGLSPYRLSLTSRNSGVNGRVVFDAGTTALQARTLVEAQDAAVFLGGSGAEQPLLITAGRNQISGVIRGVTIDLHAVSSQPVTLNISRSVDNVMTQLSDFAEGFNELVDRIRELSRFDPETQQRGLLMGDSTVQRVQAEIYAAMTGVVEGAGRYRMLSEIGLRLEEGARLAFDEEKFRAAYAADPQAVQNLFTLTQTIIVPPDESDPQGEPVEQVLQKGFGALIETRINRLIDPVDGIITQGNKTLDSRAQQFQDRINHLDRMLESKRERLERQFAQLESVLAGLQAQQESLNQIQFIQPLRARD